MSGSVFEGKRLEEKVKSSPPFNDNAHNVMRWHRGRSGTGQRGEKHGRKR